jgi:type 1 glutamine amidotransferase
MSPQCAIMNAFRPLSFVLLWLFAFILTPQAAEPLRALLVTGGCCHDYENQIRILTEGISARANVTWRIIHEGGDTRTHRVSIYENKDWARGYDVVVHNECFGQVDDDAFVENIAAAHKAGVPAVMIHCSSHSYRAAKTDAWRECVGITSVRHEKRRDFEVKNVAPDHPVMKGFPAVWLDKDDELYVNVKLWPNAVPLARAYGQDTQQDHVVIWANTCGKGRVFSTTLGHQNSTIGHDVFLDVVTRGLLWACGKLDSNGKPGPGYGATTAGR